MRPWLMSIFFNAMAHLLSHLTSFRQGRLPFNFLAVETEHSRSATHHVLIDPKSRRLANIFLHNNNNKKRANNVNAWRNVKIVHKSPLLPGAPVHSLATRPAPTRHHPHTLAAVVDRKKEENKGTAGRSKDGQTTKPWRNHS